MKLRIDRDLHDRARRCADAVGDSLADWIAIAVRCRRRGHLDDVAIPQEWRSATREAAVISIPSVNDDAPEWLRETIGMAVLHCEARAPKQFESTLVPGKDYIIGKDYA